MHLLCCEPGRKTGLSYFWRTQDLANAMMISERIAFSISVTLHYLFPMITIGGLFWLVIQSFSSRVFELKDQLFRLLFFVLIGITTGYVLKWHFSTFWPKFLEIVALAFDPLLGMEALLSIGGFFLFTVSFLYAHRRRKVALLRCSLIGLFLTTLISSVIITSVNSWMQFPSGVRLVNTPMGSRLDFDSLPEVFFNPTFFVRLLHTLLGALMLGITFQAIVSRRWNTKVTAVLALLWCVQFIVGHRHAAESYVYQPEKFAAFEGHGKTYSPADLWLFPGLDERYNIRLSGMTSYLLFNDAQKPVAGTDAWKEEYLTDKAEGVFRSYHLMVLAHFSALGLLIFIGYFGKSRERLKNILSKGLFGVLLLANFAGWYTTEWGRQPWLIRGILKTSDAVSSSQVSPWVGVAYTFAAIALPVFLWWSYRIYGRRIRG